jgi:hypothetical protein
VRRGAVEVAVGADIVDALSGGSDHKGHACLLSCGFGVFGARWLASCRAVARLLGLRGARGAASCTWPPLGAEPVAAGATPPTPASLSPCSAPRNNSHNWSKRSSTPRACRRGWAQLIATLQSLTADFDPTNPQHQRASRPAPARLLLGARSRRPLARDRSTSLLHLWKSARLPRACMRRSAGLRLSVCDSSSSRHAR